MTNTLIKHDMCPKCGGRAGRQGGGEPDKCMSCSRPLEFIPDSLDGLNGHYELIEPRVASGLLTSGAQVRKTVPNAIKGA